MRFICISDMFRKVDLESSNCPPPLPVDNDQKYRNMKFAVINHLFVNSKFQERLFAPPYPLSNEGWQGLNNDSPLLFTMSSPLTSLLRRYWTRPGCCCSRTGSSASTSRHRVNTHYADLKFLFHNITSPRPPQLMKILCKRSILYIMIYKNVNNF